MDDINNNIGAVDIDNTKRPKIVTAFAWVFIFTGIIFIATGWFLSYLGSSTTQTYPYGTSDNLLTVGMRLATIFWIAEILFIFIGLINFIISYGFFKGKKWGFWLGIIDLIIIDILALLVARINLSFLIGMVFDVWIVYSLTRQNIRGWFNKKGGYKFLIIGLIIIIFLMGFFAAETNPNNTVVGIYMQSEDRPGQSDHYQTISKNEAKGLETKGDGCSVYSSSNLGIICQKAVQKDGGVALEIYLTQSTNHPIQITRSIHCYSAGGIVNNEGYSTGGDIVLGSLNIGKNFNVQIGCYNNNGTSSFKVGDHLNAVVEFPFADTKARDFFGNLKEQKAYIYVDTIVTAEVACNQNNQCVAGGTGTPCTADSDCRSTPKNKSPDVVSMPASVEPPINPKISITAPNSGSFGMNDQIAVKWTTNSPGSSVAVDLQSEYSNMFCQLPYVINTSTGSGSFNFVPANTVCINDTPEVSEKITPGTYRINLSLGQGSGLGGWFTIK